VSLALTAMDHATLWLSQKRHKLFLSPSGNKKMNSLRLGDFARYWSRREAKAQRKGNGKLILFKNK
jgi:hypothetical protein